MGDFVLSVPAEESNAYSSFSNSSAMPFSPAAFFSGYLRTQASQLLPAAVSRPVKARARCRNKRWKCSKGHCSDLAFSACPITPSNRFR